MNNAISSLYGAGNALAGNVGGQARRQEVHTPRWFLDEAVRPAVGGVIGLDPCAASDPSRWFAKDSITAPGIVHDLEALLLTLPKGSKDAQAVKRSLRAIYSTPPELPGETLSAFVNPPFAYLQPWIEWCRDAARRGVRVVGLWPVRPGNAWWIPGCRAAGGEIVFLSARFAFEGFKAAHPEDMACVAWNCQVPDLGKWETGRWAA